MLCCQQGGEITCQPGTSTLCGVPPLGDWLITNHLRRGFDSGALGSNFGFQYQQIQKLQNEPSGTLFEKITSICIVARHPARLHTCQAMHSGHAYGAVGRHEHNPTCCADAMCHCMHTDPISMAVDSLPNGDTPPQLGSSRTPHMSQSRSWTNPFGSTLSLSGTTQITNNLILVMQQTPTPVGGQRETPATRHTDQPSQATVPISAIIRQVPKCAVAGHYISHQVSHSGETTPNFNNQFDTRTPSRLPLCVARFGVTSIILLSAYTFGVAQLVASLPLSNPTAPSRLGPCSHAGLASEFAGTKGHEIPFGTHGHTLVQAVQGTGHHTSAATPPDSHQIHLPICQTVLVAGVGLGTPSGGGGQPGACWSVHPGGPV